MVGLAHVKLPNLNLQRWFTPLEPRLATTAGTDERFGTTMFSGRPGGDDDYGFPDDETQASEAPTTRQTTPRSGGSGGGGGRGNGSGGRQRTIQFQPEDRYWTEYLRIALPIIGLILMLGLFWYWATQIIGDDTNPDDPVPTQTVGQVATIAAEPTDAVAPTEETTIAVTPDEATEPPDDEPTEEPADGDNAAEEETPADAEEEPTEDPSDTTSEEFAADDLVAVSDTEVRLRSEASTESEIVTVLSEGDELIIVAGPDSGETYEWYEVVTTDGEFMGFIASDFIVLVE